jgi:hypothetical protein
MATKRQGNRSNDIAPQPLPDSTAARVSGEAMDVFHVTEAQVPGSGAVPGPDRIPGIDSLAPDRAAGESLPGTMQPGLQPGSHTDDQFGMDLKQGGGSTGFFGDRSLELPDAPASDDLSKDSINRIDVGIDFSNLGAGGPIDGRTPDAFDGVGRGTGATGPADPGGMASDGGGSPFTTSAPGWWESSKTKDAEAKVDEVIAGIKDGTKYNPYVGIQEGIVGSVVDVPAADTADVADAADPAGEAPLPPVQQNKQQWKFVGDDVPAGGHTDGGLPARVGTTSTLEAWINTVLNDDLPPDHPDYAAVA